MTVAEQPPERTREISCDLCIVGAGIAGLNALFAASRYLARGQKVVVVDRNAAVGGMWQNTYDYVRLHQPHAMFTAGDIPWTLRETPSYLPTRTEVVAHFVHCVNTLRKRVSVEERFGYEYLSHDESRDVLVRCKSASGGALLNIRAKKLVTAFGIDVKKKPPLQLSSSQVRSVSPDFHDLLGEEMRNSTAPVYIVGGGKTAMDTAYSLLTRLSNKRITLLIGRGTMFGMRDILYPTGRGRFWGGHTPVDMFIDLAQRFDGTNERQMLDHMRSRYAVALVPDARHFMFGTLSQHENSVIAARAQAVIKDYLSDVDDLAGSPQLRLRSGKSMPIEAGSWIINCTGYFGDHEAPYAPFVSASGKVVSVGPTSAIHALTSCSAYLSVHLLYSNKLRELPLYELDHFALHRADREVFAATVGVHTLYNAGLIVPALSMRALHEFGTDTERWFPLPRRSYDGLRFLRYYSRHADHLRKALDTVRARFGVRCGPLDHAAPAPASRDELPSNAVTV